MRADSETTVIRVGGISRAADRRGGAGRHVRNVTGVVAPVAAVNNYLLPLWMIVFGAGLLRYAGRPGAASDREA